jgi:RNA polymerase sigma-70 factor (ECF subfamily)
VDTVADVGTFEQFFREQYRSFVALGAWLTGDRSAGEDLAQEACGIAHRRWSDVSGYDRPESFVRRTMVNLASNERRRRGREARAVRRLEGLASSVEDRLPPDGAVWSEVAALPVQQRAAIALRYLHDLPAADIAVALDCSEATVRVHLHRAHRRLAERLGVETKEEAAP